jgi:hypothetical protein
MQKIRVSRPLAARLLSIHSNSGRQELWRALRWELRVRKSGDGEYFGSEGRKKRNVDVAKKIFDVAAPGTDDTFFPLLGYRRLGKRAKRLVS